MTTSNLVKKAMAMGKAPGKAPAKEAQQPSATPSGIKAAAAPRIDAPAGAEASGRNQLFFDSGAPVHFGTRGTSAAPSSPLGRRFRQDHQGALGDDEERARLQAEIARLTGEISRAKARAEAAEREVQAYREPQIRAMFEARGETYTDAAAKPFLTMTAQQFAAVARFGGGAPRPRLSNRLFSVDALDLGAQPTAGGRLVEGARKMKPRLTTM